MPRSDRLRRFLAVAELFRELMGKQLAQVVRTIKDMAGEIRHESFDFEAACNFVAALARLRSAEIQLPDDELWIAALGQRFCVTKAAAELLASTSAMWPAYGDALRAEQLRINALAEQAMAFTLEGNPRATVAALLESGGSTLNAKLLDVARMSVQRHKARIPDAEALSERIESLRKRFCAGGTQVQLGNAAGRQSGGLALRAATQDAAANESASRNEEAMDLVESEA
jgi:hypothetical protein